MGCKVRNIRPDHKTNNKIIVYLVENGMTYRQQLEVAWW